MTSQCCGEMPEEKGQSFKDKLTDNTIIIKIESGVVADVYSVDPVQVVIVDYDLIEGDESFTSRVQKAVLSMVPDSYIRHEDIDALVKSLVVACSRPLRRQPFGAN